VAFGGPDSNFIDQWINSSVLNTGRVSGQNATAKTVRQAKPGQLLLEELETQKVFKGAIDGST
jgi:hypothetical protein